ncbi:hypothetical protein [Fischerella sp. JS2]|nr:hypothetical protein [Fischerella sp. JS2]
MITPIYRRAMIIYWNLRLHCSKKKPRTWIGQNCSNQSELGAIAY